jgi:trimethylamine:corrinoid methyltransferase-like protein
MTDCFFSTTCNILKFVMQNRGLKKGRYRPLTDREIKKIRDAAVAILEKTGFEYVGTEGTALFIIDLKTGRVRRTHIPDVSQLARLLDSLDNIHFFEIPVYPTELNSREVDASRFSHATDSEIIGMSLRVNRFENRFAHHATVRTDHCSVPA